MIKTLLSRRYYLIILLFFIVSCTKGQNKKRADDIKLKEGDLVFQDVASFQSVAVQLATHSEYSHCGIVFKQKDEWFVYEAVGPVKVTKWLDWVKSGLDYNFKVKRLKDNVLNDSLIKSMIGAGKKYLGLKYDLYFGWDDEKIYCSELVWKVYKNGAGIEICDLKKLKDYDLTSKEVKDKLKERYPTGIPYQEKMVSPGDLFNSNKLEEVK